MPFAASLVLAVSLVAADPESEALRAIAGLSPVWESPGLDATGSMPIGNGTLGANVWVEANGDLVLLLGHTDAFSECERLLKLGRVRISCDPPLEVGRAFRQSLDLERGTIAVRAGDATLETFADLGSPTVFVRFASATPRTVTARLETWRDAERRLEGGELNSSWLMRDAPATVAVVESADTVVPDPGAIVWYHRNETSLVPFTLERQGLAAIAAAIGDPLLHRTFGGRISFDTPYAKLDDRGVRTETPVAATTVRIATRCRQEPSAEAWLAALAETARAAGPADEAARRTHEGWRSRWRGSFVLVSPPPAPAAPILPANDHPFRLGIDSGGGNRLDGAIGDAAFVPEALDSAAIAAWTRDASRLPAGARPIVAGAGAAWTAPAGFTIVARVAPARAGLTGRIVDKVTAGRGDGFLLDLQGGRLRAVVGDATLGSGAEPPPGVASAVALVVAADGTLALFLDGTPVATGGTPRRAPPSVAEAWALQRFVAAAAAGGEFPVKFNGSIFTIAPAPINGEPWNDDWRRWGGSFWWQNTRLPYHGMLARGDGDLTAPLFDFHERLVPGCVARAGLYFDCDGVIFPETLTTFGTPGNGDYGWSRAGLEPNDVDCPWWKWAWNQGPELVALLLDRWDWLGERDRLERQAIPMARAVLEHFRSRFPWDDAGRLVISPAQSLETYWHGVTNDLPTVAGLREITERLCALPDDLGTPEDRALWERMRASVPALPMRDGLLAPAERFEPRRSNCENPELYAIWPFRLAALGSDLLEAGRASYARRVERMTHGWTQDGMQAARLGLADEAAANLLAKLGNTHPAFRFPTFWGPNFDWVPDQTHGANLLTTLQEMLLQADGTRIVLCPALPRDWSGSFRLHAPGRTVVTATVGNGRIERLAVDPPARRRDLVLGEGWTLADSADAIP